MTQPLHDRMLQTLSAIDELSPDVRFGQVLANLGFLTEDGTDRSLWEVEDEELLNIMERHLADLSRRMTHASRAPSQAN